MIPIKLPREEKMLIVADIQQYVEGELSERMGNLAAEGLLDFIAEQIAPYIYNQGIHDARRTAMEQIERLDEELSVLEKPLSKRR